ncbi:MAG: hypothetical protein IJ467_07165 [Bacteroidaceae bacterium]|nr:hypothetical protein [Bacteroidaceae bacterium]
MKILRNLACAIIACCMFSCVYNKASYLDSFESFVEEIEQSEKITEEDYKEIEVEYKKFIEDYYNEYKDELDAEEKAKVVKLKARFHAAVATHSINDAADFVKGLFK